MSDSESSSEDEQLKLLKEAVDTNFITDSMYKNDPKDKQDDKQPVEQLKSLRNIYSEEDDQFALFKVTPEFQKYVAKHLEIMLEENLKKQLKTPTTNEESTKRKRRKSRIRLFSNSKTHLIPSSEIPDTTNEINNKNARLAKSKSEKKCLENENEMIKSVVVNPEQILSKADTKNWAKSTRKRVFEYKKLKNGTLCLIDS